MRKPSPQFLARVQLRAYNLHLADPSASADSNWHSAWTKERSVVVAKTASAAKSKAKHAVPLVLECPAPQVGEVLH